MNIQFLKSKTLIIFTGYLCLAASTSCKKINELLSFNITNKCNITVNSGSPVNLPFVVATPDVTTNSSQEFQNNNTKANLVKDIRLQSLKLNITSPSGQTFGFLKSIRIYISTNASNETELASLDNVSAATNFIELVPTQSKLDEYVKSSNYSLRTEIVTRQILTNNVDISVECKFKVTANL